MNDLFDDYSENALDILRSEVGEWWDEDNQCWMPSERTDQEMQEALFKNLPHIVKTENLEVGSIKTLLDSSEVIITGNGINTVLFAPYPLLKFNDTFVEYSVPREEFKKLLV